MTATDFIAQIQPLAPNAPLSAVSALDDDINPTVAVSAGDIEKVCMILRDTPGLEFVAFSDITVADFFPLRDPRFDVVYHVVSPHRRARIRLKLQLAAGQPVRTISTVWPGAGWPEREVFDLFGIVFEGHEDLRRLMMPEDWEGHPLRKDYPVQVRKDAQTYMPLQVTAEEFRANMERDRQIRPDPGKLASSSPRSATVPPGGPSTSTGETA
jgi:NADH-quinone oxidoreductase subunit C